MNKRGVDIARDGFFQAVSHCKDKDEMHAMACMMATHSIMLLRGMMGKKFIDGFLMNAARSRSTLEPHRAMLAVTNVT